MMASENSGHAAKKRIILGTGQQFDAVCSTFPAVGMVAHLTAQGVGQKLVSVAYAEQWDGLIHSLLQPCCGPFAPGLAVTDHGGGTCHDNAVPVSRVSGQLSGFRIEHGNVEPG